MRKPLHCPNILGTSDPTVDPVSIYGHKKQEKLLIKNIIVGSIRRCSVWGPLIIEALPEWSALGSEERSEDLTSPS